MTTIQLYDEPTCLTLREVAEQLVGCGAIPVAEDEDIGNASLENGTDLTVEINRAVEGDPRCSGYNVRTDVVTMYHIREWFTQADYYAWGKDEDGDDCLYCFGC